MPPEIILEGFKDELIEEIKDLKKVLRRQGLLLEVLKKELQGKQQEKDHGIIPSFIEIAEDFFHLERSFKNRSTLSISQIQAFGLVWERIETLLESLGITLIRTRGETYDPRLYEAIETVSSGNGPPKVKEVVLPGYQIQGKVVKAAKAIIEQ